MPNKFVVSFKVSPKCVFIVFFSFFTVIIPSCQRLSYYWRPSRFVNMMKNTKTNAVHNAMPSALEGTILDEPVAFSELLVAASVLIIF